MAALITDNRDEDNGIPVRDMEIGCYFTRNGGVFLRASEVVVVNCGDGLAIDWNRETAIGVPVDVEIVITDIGSR